LGDGQRPALCSFLSFFLTPLLAKSVHDLHVHANWFFLLAGAGKTTQMLFCSQLDFVVRQLTLMLPSLKDFEQRWVCCFIISTSQHCCLQVRVPEL